MIQNMLTYLGAAVAEIAGCFAFWLWLRSEQSPLWLLPGIVSLCFFAYLLTLVETTAAGRAFAAYGGVYIVCSLIWLRYVEKVSIDRWDVIGAIVCLIGALIILAAPRGNVSTG